MTSAAPFVPTEYNWLLLRFSADRQARASALGEALQRALTGAKQPLQILDLGAGAGANLLHLAPRLPAQAQSWTLIDRDAALVERVRACFAHMSEHLPGLSLPGRGPDASDADQLYFDDRRIDYRAHTGDFLSPESPIYQQTFDLVSANAVFDLLTADQLDAFFQLAVAKWADSRPLMYFTINLDHTLRFAPARADDDLVRALFHAHMQRPQPPGRSLGPDSAAKLADLARAHGLRVTQGSSGWHIASDAKAMLHKNLDFIDGAVHELIAGGATELSAAAFDAWLAERRQAIEHGQLSLEVGHQDFLIEWP
ncbi:MAG: hypothetical protein Tsb0020_06740 [Haliangiales bacterium]